MAKRLYRSRQSSIIAGVCGGLGEYFDVDPVLLRIVAVILLFPGGIGLIAYIVAWIAMPSRPEDVPVEPAPKSEFAKYIPGVILIALGMFFLAHNLVWWLRFDYIWPLGLVAIGLVLMLRSVNGRKDKENADDSVQS